ncbi:staygreen family protein [Hathewaya limosa]|uniref:Staygreen protein domain-containing protein n=1 Tax=Hathewaya limosa TaxID=1536 RepID=A0ABU0JUR9_HATLI|nr:staygreen family protein [Hathewaya limosa]MDQ0480160.1 hypothetical protein [Hathewaya limosa]
MYKFNKDKVNIFYEKGTKDICPIIPRRYTLTHSDKTGDLFITIGSNFATQNIDLKQRDEVLAKWAHINDQYIFCVYVLVDNENLKNSAEKRNKIFREELPLAIKGLAYADKELFITYPYLNSSPIYVYFHSTREDLNRIEFSGHFYDFIKCH